MVGTARHLHAAVTFMSYYAYKQEQSNKKQILSDIEGRPSIRQIRF